MIISKAAIKMEYYFNIKIDHILRDEMSFLACRLLNCVLYVSAKEWQ